MCDVCGGSVLIYLGWLGKFLWFRCRDCGAEFYREEGEE